MNGASRSFACIEKVAAQRQPGFLSVAVNFLKPALGTCRTDFQIQPRAVGQALPFLVGWAGGISALVVGQYGAFPGVFPALGRAVVPRLPG